jgi:hypothetical protein
MAEMTWHVEIPATADAPALAQQIQERLAALHEVDDVEAAPESTRLAVEIIAGIAITVSIIRGAGEIADALQEVIPKVRRVLEELGLRHATVEVGDELVPADQVNREHTQRMSA